MAHFLTDPTPAYVLGLIADMHREQRSLLAALARKGGDDAALMGAVAALAETKKALFALRAESHGAARLLGEKNQLQGELLPRLTKLRARSEALRQSQLAQAKDAPEAARLLRRSRAVVDVQIEDLQKDVDRAQTEAQALRQRLQGLDGQLRAGRERQQELQRRVTDEQAGHATLLPSARLCALNLALAHGQLRLCGPRPTGAEVAAWSATVRSVAETWGALGAGMAAGRFAEDDTQTLMGGRSSLTAEILAGLVALGDIPGAQTAFVRLCSEHGFLHQLFFVFRAFALGMTITGEHGPLFEVLRMHRYAQGLRGALAECLWQLLRGDAEGFVRLLPKVVALEAQMWAASDLPGLGLISLMGCALCRLGTSRGFELPENLGPTVPLGPWSVATPALVR